MNRNRSIATLPAAFAGSWDPLLQLRQTEVQTKQADVQRKAQKDQMDYELEQERLNIEKVKATAQFQKDTAALDHKNTQADKRIELDTLREMIKAKLANQNNQKG